MKSKFRFVILLFLALFSFQSCEDQNDVLVRTDTAIQEFIWNGLNLFYLWQGDVPDLADNRFASEVQFNSFLSNYSEPENLFDSLLYKPDSRYSDAEAVDRFSWIVDDYLELEGQLQGNTNSNGVEFGLSYKNKALSDEVIGWVRYIVPNSDAATKDIKRGDIFYAVDGIQLTITNYATLLFGATNNYTLNFANYDNGNFSSNGKSVALTKSPLEENPILINKVISSGSHKIGYLMYNGFYSNYDTELNNAFGLLKSEGITDLVLDLRYNGGGSVQSATRLASMITGSFTGQVFAKEQWNAKLEPYFDANDLLNFFPSTIGNTPIQSVGMTKVYILTTINSASASELIINGLKPYIEVIQIGTKTTGKNVGSITLYDSPNFGKNNRNPNHRYAMQPIVCKTVNAQGFGDYQSGIAPTYEQVEYINTLGILGDSNETLLSAAIAKITGIGRMKPAKSGMECTSFSDSKSRNKYQNQMYLEKAPKSLGKALRLSSDSFIN